VAAIANQFVIRHIDPASPDFLYSSNLWDVAARNGLYSPERDGPLLDFLKTFAPMRAHSSYVTRRVWRVFSLVAPTYARETGLSPYTDPYASDYPFSVKPDAPLTPQVHLGRYTSPSLLFHEIFPEPSFLPSFLHLPSALPGPHARAA